MKVFNIKPDVVTGISTNTLGGRELVEKLCDVKGLNLIDSATTIQLKNILTQSLGFKL